MTSGPNLGAILKQAQQLQTKLSEIQEQLQKKVIEASSGGGMVVATVNGRQELVGLKIEKEVINPNDVEMLQDLVVAAINAAMKKAQAMMQEEMGKLTGGMGLPPGLFPAS